jgi:hypothetical protein
MRCDRLNVHTGVQTLLAHAATVRLVTNAAWARQQIAALRILLLFWVYARFSAMPLSLRASYFWLAPVATPMLAPASC